MTKAARKFLLDSNVFIEAHRKFYAFDICPGFWESLKSSHKSGRIFSTQRVKAELLAGKDALARWVSNELTPSFFLDDSNVTIIAAYTPMMAWVQKEPFNTAAKNKFATDADGWLIATAKHFGYCLVTQEVLQQGAKARVPIPNVCDKFGVNYCNMFEMLREIPCSFK